MPELQLLPHSTFPADPQWQALHELVDLVAARQRLDFGQISSTQKPDGSLVTACDQWSDAKNEGGTTQASPAALVGAFAKPNPRKCNKLLATQS